MVVWEMSGVFQVEELVAKIFGMEVLHSKISTFLVNFL
jgi:uncharacterized membrane protein YuzA (DUF378 family)